MSKEGGILDAQWQKALFAVRDLIAEQLKAESIDWFRMQMLVQTALGLERAARGGHGFAFGGPPGLGVDYDDELGQVRVPPPPHEPPDQALRRMIDKIVPIFERVFGTQRDQACVQRLLDLLEVQRSARDIDVPLVGLRDLIKRAWNEIEKPQGDA